MSGGTDFIIAIAQTVIGAAWIVLCSIWWAKYLAYSFTRGSSLPRNCTGGADQAAPGDFVGER